MYFSNTLNPTKIASAIALSIGLAASPAMASPTISAAVGGVPVGADIYENFDSLSSTGGVTGTGITVSFTGDAGVAGLPNVDGQYAAPYISNSNGTLFGDFTVNGQDATPYLTTGIGTVILDLDEEHKYFGLLWGSVDSYNTLSFYDVDGGLVFQFTGANVTGLANGDQGAEGTYYVNINSDTAFKRVVASSTQYAFEFDNVALAKEQIPPAEVPEPGILLLFGTGLLMVSAARRNARL